MKNDINKKHNLFLGLVLPNWITGRDTVRKTTSGTWVGGRFFPDLPDLNTPLSGGVDKSSNTIEEKEEGK